ncbi:hypothetical protein IWQ60_003991 [Tieghemiomyces parasiticus]|uniref:Uncharacterized protein n=1 Tax=Tieghemiomyces parasiticus TaxID=78921 RepID=A0A9W8A939_9FUNG|nr:hypothetical protein IWQ60_003991 [Tieghemiomyces parasiticus]
MRLSTAFGVAGLVLGPLAAATNYHDFSGRHPTLETTNPYTAPPTTEESESQAWYVCAARFRRVDGTAISGPDWPLKLDHALSTIADEATNAVNNESLYPFTGLSKYSKKLNYQFDDFLLPRFRCLSMAYKKTVSHLDHLGRSPQGLSSIEQQLGWHRAASNVQNYQQRDHVRSSITRQLWSLDTCIWMMADGKASLAYLTSWRQYLVRALLYAEPLLSEAPKRLSTLAARQVPQGTRENLEDLIVLVQNHVEEWQVDVDSWHSLLADSIDLESLLTWLLDNCSRYTSSHTVARPEY